MEGVSLVRTTFCACVCCVNESEVRYVTAGGVYCGRWCRVDSNQCDRQGQTCYYCYCSLTKPPVPLEFTHGVSSFVELASTPHWSPNSASSSRSPGTIPKLSSYVNTRNSFIEEDHSPVSGVVTVSPPLVATNTGSSAARNASVMVVPCLLLPLTLAVVSWAGRDDDGGMAFHVG